MKFKAFAGLAVMCITLTALLWLKSQSTPAPDSNFVMLDGTSINMQDLRGQVVLVNFWATSCTTCVAEMPDLINIYEKHRSKGYRTIAVAMSYDPPSYVVNFANSRKLPFQVAIDNTGNVARLWGDVKLTPTTFLIDKKGNIVKRFVGTPNFAELNKLIENLLESK